MKVLILGSSGLIGSHLMEHLKNDHEIVQFDTSLGAQYDLSTETGKHTLERTLESGIDFVFFLAYDVGSSKYLQTVSPINYAMNNMNLMKNTFECLIKSDVPFIFASSTMYNMYCVYGSLKSIGEHITNSTKNGFSVRFWNIYGRQSFSGKSHLITDLIHQCKTTGQIRLQSDGTERRQFVHARDCAKALTACMLNHNQIIKETKALDITSGKWISIREIAEIISAQTGCPVVSTGNVPNNHTHENVPDGYLNKFWTPEISIEDGIRELLV